VGADRLERARVVEKIVSGAQTGADRAALDWAIFRDIPHGGWCPKGRKAEDYMSIQGSLTLSMGN
jgi:hypothetical protein